MRLRIPKGLSFALCPGSLDPPQLCGAFIVKATFTFQHDEPPVLAEEPDPVTGDRHEGDDPAGPLHYPSDFALFKPRTDFVVVASARTPRGEPVQALGTGIAVGAFSKMFDLRSQSGPFVEARLAHRWAAEGAPRPRPRARPPEPVLAGFGPIPANWPQRQALTGTYDAAYMRERWPWFPADFDYGYFNAAPRDQQLDGYLRGDEDLALQHLQRDHPILRTKLPGFRVRCLVQIRAADGVLRDIEPQMRLDTLWIDVDAGRLVLVWRGLAEVRTPKMREVESVVIVTEPLAQAARPAAHYRYLLTDKPVGKDADTLAQEAESARKFAQLDIDMAEMSGVMAGHEAEMAEAEKQMEAHAASALAQLPPDAVLPPASPAPSAAETTAQIKAAIAEMLAQDPILAETLGDIDAHAFAQAEAEFAAMAAAAAEFEEEMRPDVWTRERVIAAAAANTPMTDLDLARLDLSGLDLSGQDLSGSRLVGARLDGTRLVRTRLVGADLTGAQLAGAELIETLLDRADLSDADFTGATMTRVSLTQTRLAGLNLAGADLSGCVGREANFAKANLAGTRFAGARLPAADFTASVIDDADFSGAMLVDASFGSASAKRADFTDVSAAGLRADDDANFEGACFRGAHARRAVFDTSNLDHTDFSRARLMAAQFEGASMRSATFDRADLTGAMFDDGRLQGATLTHANFLRASLEGADLTGAVADGANAFEAGFWRSTDAPAAFAQANRKSTLIA